MEAKFQAEFDLTTSEIDAYKTCMKKESIIRGALPGAAYGAFLGYISNIILKSKGIRSTAPWIVSTTLGYFIGRNSYGLVCLDKAVPRLRKEFQERHEERRREKMGLYTTQISDSQEYSDILGTPVVDSRSANIFDPSPNSRDTGEYADISDMEVDLTEKPVHPQQSLSYEELRNRNRNEYLRKYQRTYAPKPQENDVKPEVASDDFGISEDQEDTSLQYDTGMKNKYGDVWS